MDFRTHRKRAEGLGAAQTGTEHFWNMQISSVGLLVLIPLFVFTLGPVIGAPHDQVVDRLSSPFPAIIVALTLIVGLLHFKNGVQTLIEDYVHGLAGKISMIVMICISYGTLGVGLFALARLAL